MLRCSVMRERADKGPSPSPTAPQRTGLPVRRTAHALRASDGNEPIRAAQWLHPSGPRRLRISTAEKPAQSVQVEGALIEHEMQEGGGRTEKSGNRHALGCKALADRFAPALPSTRQNVSLSCSQTGSFRCVRSSSGAPRPRSTCRTLAVDDVAGRRLAVSIDAIMSVRSQSYSVLCSRAEIKKQLVYHCQTSEAG